MYHVHSMHKLKIGFLSQFHLSVGIIGVVYLVATVMYVLGSIFSGPLTDKLVGEITLWQVFLFLCARNHPLEWLRLMTFIL